MTDDHPTSGDDAAGFRADSPWGDPPAARDRGGTPPRRSERRRTSYVNARPVRAAQPAEAAAPQFDPGAPVYDPLSNPRNHQLPAELRLARPVPAESIPRVPRQPAAQPDPGQQTNPIGLGSGDDSVDLATLRRSFGGLRQISVTNPCPAAGRSVAAEVIAAALSHARGEAIQAWQIGAQSTSSAFLRSREALAGQHQVIVVDTGSRADHPAWATATDSTDQLVITVTAAPGVARSAADLITRLSRAGRGAQVSRAVAVITRPDPGGEVVTQASLDPLPLELAQAEFFLRQHCRLVAIVPSDRHLAATGAISWRGLSPASRRAWLRVAAAVAAQL